MAHLPSISWPLFTVDLDVGESRLWLLLWSLSTRPPPEGQPLSGHTQGHLPRPWVTALSFPGSSCPHGDSASVFPAMSVALSGRVRRLSGHWSAVNTDLHSPFISINMCTSPVWNAVSGTDTGTCM